MPVVNTVRGQVDSADLGPTLMHEHILITSPGIKENWPDLWDEQACAAKAKQKFSALQQRGVGTLVDVTTADMGRDVHFLRDVQAKTNVNIIAATGIYWQIPFYWLGRDPDELAQAFISEITKGIAGTDVRAGIIKLATHMTFNSPNEACLRAGARAHRATGVPITTHAFPQEMGREQQRIFHDEGVDLSRVVIGHQGDRNDIDYYKELLDAGSTIGIDHFGFDHFPGRDWHGFEGRVGVVAQLVADGYGDRIVLSHDAQCCPQWGILQQIPMDKNPNWHYNHISDDVVPALLQRGVTQQQVDQLLIGNPRRLFEQQGAY